LIYSGLDEHSINTQIGHGIVAKSFFISLFLIYLFDFFKGFKSIYQRLSILFLTLLIVFSRDLYCAFCHQTVYGSFNLQKYCMPLTQKSLIERKAPFNKNTSDQFFQLFNRLVFT